MCHIPVEICNTKFAAKNCNCECKAKNNVFAKNPLSNVQINMQNICEKANKNVQLNKRNGVIKDKLTDIVYLVAWKSYQTTYFSPLSFANGIQKSKFQNVI